MTSPSPTLSTFDLPDNLHLDDLGPSVAIDTETMGLQPHRDRLCLVQLADSHGRGWLVHFPEAGQYHKAVKLKALLAAPHIQKIFHYARFDMAVLSHYLGTMPQPVFCTKIASKLCRTFTQNHGLKDLCWDLLGVKLNKEEQTSDWGAPTLKETQLAYAMADVRYLHALQEKLIVMLQRVNRLDLAQACYGFLSHRAQLDLLGWQDDDIFKH